MEKLHPGRYVVAVSGGVDSMVLLDMLRQDSNLSLVVAHIDHGIRSDSAADAAFVQQYCTVHGLQYVTTRLQLGLGASEATARAARYEFLRRCCKEYKAKAIVTAHHQNDLMETAILALMRGTGWRGLAPFVSVHDVLRPLVTVPKWQLVGYARRHNITWREDSTNANERYTRNYIRHTLIPLLDQKSEIWREEFLQKVRKQQDLSRTINILLDSLCKKSVLSRHLLIMAPPKVAYELLQQMCRMYIGNSLERPLAESALLFAKTAKPHKTMELNKHWQLRTDLRQLIVEPRTP
jgi:tRNA(Ile)-lysidine synthetase-like protein